MTVTIPSDRFTCSVSRWSDEDEWSEPGCASDIGGTILAPMGFNPHRQYRRTNADYLMVGAAVIACVLLLMWALFG